MISKWAPATIGDTCEILDNRRKPVTKSDRVQGLIPYYGASGILDYVKDYIFDEKLVLLGEDGAKWGAGDRSAFIIEGKAWVNNHAHVLRPNREILLDEWLTYFLIGSDLSDYISGVTVPKLNQGKMREIQFPLPPLDEQKRIVAKLDDAITMLDKYSSRIDSQITQAQLLENAYKTELFKAIHLADKNTTLGQVAEKVVVGFVGTCAPFYTPDGVPFLRTQNVTKAGLDISQFQRISREFHLSNKKSQLLEGDVLLSRVITNDVNVGIVPRELGEANCANVVIVRPGKKLLPEFLAAYISTKTAQKYLLDRKVGSAQVVVNTGVVKDWPIIAPSVKEQKEIMDKLDVFLDMHQKRVAKLYEISKSLNSFRSSILSAAYEGDF